MASRQILSTDGAGLKYRIIPVSNYDGTRPNFEDRVIELSDSDDILSISSSLPFSIDIFQSSSAIVRIGRLTLELDNNFGVWTPGIKHFANSNRDHRFIAYTDDGGVEVVFWAGFVKNIELISNARVRIICHHELDRLDDIIIAGDDDEGKMPVSIQSIVKEIEAQLPIYLSPIMYDGVGNNCRLLYRPDRDISARRYLGQALVSELLVMDLPPGAPKLTIKPFGWLSPAPPLEITADDAIKFTVLDEKERMYNVIEYKPFGVEDDITYRGRDEIYQAPASFIHQFGVRELKLNFEHLSPLDAEIAAKAWQDESIAPRRRAKLSIPTPADSWGIATGQIISLKMDHINHSLIPYYGFFQIVSLSLNLKQKVVDLEIREILDYTG